MTIWNCIRDWFVQYVFGGTLSNQDNVFSNILGSFYDAQMDNIDVTSTCDFYVGVGDSIIDGTSLSAHTTYFLSIGDWLSTTATIITLCLLVFMLYLFARWVFKQCAGLLSF